MLRPWMRLGMNSLTGPACPMRSIPLERRTETNSQATWTVLSMDRLMNHWRVTPANLHDNTKPKKSLDASGEGVFRIIIGPTMLEWIRAAASTQTLCGAPGSWRWLNCNLMKQSSQVIGCSRVLVWSGTMFVAASNGLSIRTLKNWRRTRLAGKRSTEIRVTAGFGSAHTRRVKCMAADHRNSASCQWRGVN